MSVSKGAGVLKDLTMKVVFGSDDDSPVVRAVRAALEARDVELNELPQGAWPEVARQVAEAVAEKRADTGVLMCWTGTGTSIMANKVKGVRAALCWEPWIAEGARRWNDANVLVMSLKRIDPETATQIVDSWFSVEGPDEDERENIAKLSEYEDGR